MLSGQREDLAAVQQRLEARGVRCRAIAVDVASHSPAVDPLAGPLGQELSDLAPRPAEVALLSTVRGEQIDGAALGADYWVENLRRTVRLWEAVELAWSQGHRAFVEISPHPVLLSSLAEGLGRDALLLDSGRRDSDERARLLASLGRLYEAGLPLRWEALYPDPPGRVALPRYPFQRQPHLPPRGGDRPVAPGANPLLGEALELAGEPDQAVFSLTLDPRTLPFVDDHSVEGERVLPGTGSVELAAAAASARWPGETTALVGLTFHRPLLLPPDEVLELQVRLRGRTAQVWGRLGAGWTLRVDGEVVTARPGPPLDLDAVRGRCPDERAGEALYTRLNATGNLWGPAFQGVRRLWVGPGELLARVEAPASIADDVDRHLFHPALLDACGQALVELSPAHTGPFVLASLERAATFTPPRGVLWAHIVARGEGGQEGGGGRDLTGDVLIHDARGAPVAEMIGLCVRFLHSEANQDRLPAEVGQWLHDVGWSEAQPGEPRPCELPQKIVPDHGGLAAHLAGELDTPTPEPGAGPRDVVWLAGLTPAMGDDATAEEVQARVLDGCSALARQCRQVCEEGGRLWIVTRGAHRILDDDEVDPAQASLWGLGQVLAAEHPARLGGLVDLDPADSPAEAAGRLAGWLREASADRVALRGARRLVPRLQRITDDGPPAAAALLRPDGAYLVSGGLGGLGLRTARRLVRLGARRLVLLGRTALPPRSSWGDPDEAGTATAVLELESLGAHVELVTGDVSQPAALEALVARRARDHLPPICGVVHAAGVQHPAAMEELDPERLARELRPKVAGTVALWRALGGELDFMVLYSSTATLLDSPLLGGYTAANAFLDAFACRQRAAGHPVLAVDWGVWEEVGMARRYADRTGRRLVGRGVGGMEPSRALDALERALALGRGRVGVMPMDWARWVDLHPEAARGGYLSLLTGGGDPAQDGEPRGRGLRQRLEGLDAPARRTLLEDHLRRRLARVMGARPEAVPVDHPLTRLGLDSLMALELRNRLEADTGVTVAVVYILQCASLRQLACRLDDELGQPGGDGDWEEVTI